MRASLFVFLVALLVSGKAWAWGDTGHKVICEMAMRLALPSTRAEIRRLLKADEEYDYFRDSCIWPDRPRKRAEEHYVNLPRDAAGLSGKQCPATSTCVLTAIEADYRILASTSATDAEKLDALKYLGHWVGDVHQPLHVSFADDHGGNDITATGLCTGKLHAVWDTCLVQKAVGEDIAAAATQLLASITPATQEAWTHADLTAWANESFAVAEDSKVNYCVRNGASCDLPSPPVVTIDADYIDKNVPLVREQLQKAAVRLTQLLDAALGR